MDVSEQLNKPWKRQRILKKEDIPLQEQIIDMALSYDNLQERALFILIYLTAGRLTEVIRKRYLYKNRYLRETYIDQFGKSHNRIARNKNGSPIIIKRTKIELNYLGIRKKDLIFTEKKGKRLMVVSMQNRKSKQFKRKNIPIPIEKEQKLVQMLVDYIKPLPDEASLFNFGRSKAQRIIAKTGMNPHFLRDIRLTHMVTMYDFNTYQLVKFAGWKDPRPSERYVRLTYSDLIDKF